MSRKVVESVFVAPNAWLLCEKSATGTMHRKQWVTDGQSIRVA